MSTTIEQEYEIAKANFIHYSRLVLKKYDTEEPLIIFIADAVRKVFKTEPILKGNWCNEKQLFAKSCFRAMISYNTNLSLQSIAVHVGISKKSHRSIRESIDLSDYYYKTSSIYKKKFDKIQKKVNDFKILINE